MSFIRLAFSKSVLGALPQTPEFNALSKKVKLKVEMGDRALPLSPLHFFPMQALGFALQHHPILLIGISIISSNFILKLNFILMRQLSYCKSMLLHYNCSLNTLNYLPVLGDHLT